MNQPSSPPPTAETGGGARDDRLERSERFRNRAGGWFHLAAIAGLVVGGWWALREFQALQRAETARAQLEVLRLEAEALPSLRLALDVEQLVSSRDPAAKWLAVTVEAENPGAKPACMTLRGHTPVRVIEVVGHRHDGRYRPGTTSLGQPPRYVPRGSGPRSHGSAIVAPGVTDSLAFLVEVPRAGLYHVQFVAEPTPCLHDAAAGDADDGAAGVDAPPPTTWWTIDRFVTVE